MTSCYHSERLNDNLISDPVEKNTSRQESLNLESDHDNAMWPDTELGMDGSFTLGITFAIRGKLPKIRICNTWGRYEFSNKHLGMKIFQRKTNYYLTDWMEIPQDKIKKLELNNSKNGNVITKPGVELHIKATKSDDDSHIVQIFLVNKTQYNDRDKNGKPKRQDETHRIFQPQMRINVDTDSKVDYLGKYEDETDRPNEFLLYHKQRTRARGFQCGAVWKEVDPENDEDESGFRSFSWMDGANNIIPKDIRSSFTCPDVRTEYIPAYSILQPEIDSRSYDAGFLARNWDPATIREHIEPITQKYGEWISQQDSYLKSHFELSKEKLVEAGQINLNACKESLEEIKKGIQFVCSDECARLSFCFMNKVMSEKYKYDNRDKNVEGQKLRWREFQMGFILQSLRGVTGKDNKELADVLWFPTGGGKTEAYLGIIVFTIAYRRLLEDKVIKMQYGQTLNNDGGVNVISRYTLRLLTIQQFQRAVGTILLSDLMRVKNWIPEKLDEHTIKFKSDFLNKRFSEGNLWGNSRFSIGLWIGGDSTPTRFATQKGMKGKHILNAEGALRADNKRKELKGDPIQIQNCPICGSILSFPIENLESHCFDATWIIKTKKSLNALRTIPKSEFDHPHKTVLLRKVPEFSEISQTEDGYSFIRVKMSLQIKKSPRRLVDCWWDDIVNKKFASEGKMSLTSTRASSPGYFFLQQEGENRPYDFSIYCTNEECDLNKTEWFERLNNKQMSDIPEQFKNKQKDNVSISVPISAFTVDEQIYSRCPTFMISTSDKFANLPWNPRCASIFGNVDCRHHYFGYGRRHDYKSPILNRQSKPTVVDQKDLVDSERFIPPSLIIQDELHLIEGPLGSMVGVYEMAIDTMCTVNNCHPKYISSSATITEAKTQIKTIFRRDVRLFPHPGISSLDSFFAKSEEDISCIKPKNGRLYLGICSAKSVFELPIKICAILMSTAHKIRENPENYGISQKDVDKELDPYWTFISYFSDLQLMSRFGGFYHDDIERDVERFSPYRIGYQQVGKREFSPGIRFIPITLDRNFDIHGISVYCHKAQGRIKIGIFDDSKLSKMLWESENPSKCATGENSFDLENRIYVKKDQTVWIAVMNDESKTFFRTIKPDQSWFEKEDDKHGFKLPDGIIGKKSDGETICVELTGKQRKLEEDNKIEMSSETRFEDLPKFLERLQQPLSSQSVPVDALLTSPVFGTGIDVDRLGLINIMTQPKTTSAYIQATGRVGRQKPGLVITWLIARRARDLDHYENFIGYHRRINSFVEPITANPFSDESLELNLGPIIVSILRNARDVSGQQISNEWIDEESGPQKIIEHRNGNSIEIKAVKSRLKEIASFDKIPEFRQNQRFENILDNQLNKWLELVERYKNGDIIYGERNPIKPVEKNVILGTPFHELRGFDSAFKNTRNSLRNTESTSMFYSSDTTAPIRPSQFITRYGSGSFLPSNSNSMVALSVYSIIRDLQYAPGNFFEYDMAGKKGLQKLEIDDRNMIKMLLRYNSDKEFNEIKIFSMPTNASLNSNKQTVKDFDRLYEAKLFPEWGICSRHKGDRILAKITHIINGTPAIHCPLCKEQRNESYSTVFSNVRLVVACKNGHMSDVSWNKEIHRNSSCSHNVNDENRVFIWNESSAGDDLDFSCHGVWKGDEFIETKCFASTKYSSLRHLSNDGQLQCQGRFIEEDSDNNPHPCDATPIIARKSMMSLRSPIILSSLKIQKRHSILFNKLKDFETFFAFIEDYDANNKDWTPRDLADRLEGLRSSKKHEGLIMDIRKATKRDLQRVCEEKEQADNEQGSISESKSLKEELRSLENGVEEGSKQVQNTGGQPREQVKYPISWDSNNGLSFEAMPFSDITVTTVQMGYTREISEIVKDSQPKLEQEKAIQMRLGKLVTKYSKYDDEKGKRWYLGHQNNGEGIFIRLNPTKHKDGKEVFTPNDDNFKAWDKFHCDVSKFVDERLKIDKLNPEDRDNLEKAKMRTNPLFVWWHSLAHQIISELSIDSGFSTTALSERIYCVRNSNGSYRAGILIYVSTAGSDGTLGGLTSLVDDDILPKIVDKALRRIMTCSNDPVCSDRKFERGRHRGAACHSCILAPETTCSYLNKFLDRNLVRDRIL